MPIFPKKFSKLSRADQSLARLDNFKKEVVTDSHIIALEELCDRLHTDLDVGLTALQAKEVLSRTGPNKLTPSKKESQIVAFFKKLFYGFSSLLWIGAGLCFLSILIEESVHETYDRNNLVLGCVLIIVVVVTGSFTYYQERKSQKVMESFNSMIPSKATVIREGSTQIIDSKNIVTGDLVDIKFGDRVPADLRLIHCQNLKVDNSPLTGESDPQPRSSKSYNENFLESRNVAFFSTNVIEGTGRGIVVACGDHTVMGHIAGLTARLKPNKTPLAKELDRFMKIISIWACCLGLILGILLVALEHPLLTTLLFVIGMIVANVPEGLLATVILCLTLTAKRMASKNCVVKKLDSVETLGSTSVICSDKTGTLTQNRMTVVNIWYSGKVVQVDFDHLDLQKKQGLKDSAYRNLLRCATFCNRADFLDKNSTKPLLQREVSGDASEVAIFKYVQSLNLFQEDFKERNRKLAEIPFSSTTKYQISVHGLENKKCLVVLKGAPEVVLERCTTIIYDNETRDLDKSLLEECNRSCKHFAEMGERVLGFCDLELDETFNQNFSFSIEPINFPIRGLRFLGFIALIDPPRPQVPDAVRKCKMAGIKVVMVTGDHPVTAKAIAKKVGIISHKTVDEFTTVVPLDDLSFSPLPAAAVISGSFLRSLLQDDLDGMLQYFEEIVFARTSPQQKLQIVESYQRLGEIVAVTGDGVNDAPALKKSDIGVAMGITGTEVSQQAADLILLDDNFASITLGIEEGRRIFDNLKKSVAYTLASNVPEIIPFMAYAFLEIPLPLGIIAVICIDLLTDMMPAISLAYEKAESDIMLRPPRNPLRDRLVNRKLYFLSYGLLGMIEAMGLFFVYFLQLAEYGFNPNRVIGLRREWEGKDDLVDSYGRTWTRSQRKVLQGKCFTSSMMSVVVCQWANLVACKTRRNSLFHQGMRNTVGNVSLVVETILTLILAYAPYTYVLDFYPISWKCWIYALPFAVLLFAFDEYRKWHIRKYPKGWFQRETDY